MAGGNFTTTQTATTVVSATGVAAAAVTLTIPAAPAGLFNYLCFLEISQYATAALTGGATPVLVTSTGLTGTPTFTFSTALAIGAAERLFYPLGTPVKGSAAATAITIVCPATTSVIWRVNVTYFVAP